MSDKKERAINAEIIVAADIPQVWEAWTTEEGARTFFAPDCKINLQPGGAYEMYFAPESPPGLRGGEGCRVMAVQPEKMLSFSWNAPPNLPEVRGHFTHVIIRLSLEKEGTRVTLNHDGWGEGREWDQALSYFDAAWNRVVLPRLAYRFEHGPVDWQEPPKL